jgi:hypothetical protein
MKLDPAATLGAVIRDVAFRAHEGKPARAVIATRSYDTDIDDLWDALTSAERIPRWFCRLRANCVSVAAISCWAMPAARSRAASRRGYCRSPGSLAAARAGSP